MPAGLNHPAPAGSNTSWTTSRPVCAKKSCFCFNSLSCSKSRAQRIKHQSNRRRRLYGGARFLCLGGLGFPLTKFPHKSLWSLANSRCCKPWILLPRYWQYHQNRRPIAAMIPSKHHLHSRYRIPNDGCVHHSLNHSPSIFRSWKEPEEPPSGHQHARSKPAGRCGQTSAYLSTQFSLIHELQS